LASATTLDDSSEAVVEPAAPDSLDSGVVLELLELLELPPPQALSATAAKATRTNAIQPRLNFFILSSV
jgi:hypothetical protein